MDPDLPTQGLRDRWAEVGADLDGMVDELEAEGWQTVAFHPGDVTTSLGGDGRPPGLDVMVADNEFEALADHVADGAAFDESAVFREAAGGVAFLVCVVRDPDRGVAALVPAFYPQQGERAQALAEHAHAAGEVHVTVHPLGRDRTVTFTIDEPALVFPRD